VCRAGDVTAKGPPARCVSIIARRTPVAGGSDNAPWKTTAHNHYDRRDHGAFADCRMVTRSPGDLLRGRCLPHPLAFHGVDLSPRQEVVEPCAFRATRHVEDQFWPFPRGVDLPGPGFGPGLAAGAVLEPRQVGIVWQPSVASRFRGSRPLKNTGTIRRMPDPGRTLVRAR